MTVAETLRRVPVAAWVGGVRSAFAAERERWPLWLPVGIGAGIGVYFALPFEPGFGAAAGLLALALALGLFGMHRTGKGGQGGGWIVAAFLIGAPALGFLAVKGQSARVAAPVLAERLGPVMVTGRIAQSEPALKGVRLTLEVSGIDRLPAEKTPHRVRVRVRPALTPDGAGALRPGAGVEVLAILLPPPAPAVPGGYDFARAAWFDGVGAVGFAVRPPQPRPAAGAGPGVLAGAWAWAAEAVEGLRGRLFARITAALPGAAGGIAGALMTGQRGHIPEDAMEAMRAAGLAHLLAISGLHIGLVTGILFFGLRAVLALMPRIAVRHPIKKWAAAAALAGAFAYMLLTGATVPTQRAFLMVALVLGAVMLDRSALSMRLVAFAAAVILLLAPDSLTGPSFQMSFAAVAALIAGYEVLRGPLTRLHGEGGVGRRALVYLLGVLITTLIAGLATAPFALYHFNRLAAYGIAANLGAVPLTAFWIMPLATLAYLLMPLGLEEIALRPMGWGIDGVLAIARTIADSPGASLFVPTMPVWGLGLITLGGLWLILWRRPWRLAGLAAVAAGLLSVLWAPAPDLLIAGDGRAFAVRKADGNLVFADGAGSRFQRNIWLRRSGLAGDLAPPAAARRARKADGRDAAQEGVLRCDALACVAHIRGFVTSVIRHPAAVAEDCPRADLVIALTSLYRFPCRGGARLISRRALAREGSHAVWFEGEGAIRIESVAGRRGERPWTAGRALR
ncbi:MAG: ComEC/Rec2 family competence protein [Alphaproteobacteria bacterium]|nr:ComEC/Rec2 family competence protein [Alphaproteobacteria bacterium]